MLINNSAESWFVVSGINTFVLPMMLTPTIWLWKTKSCFWTEIRSVPPLGLSSRIQRYVRAGITRMFFKSVHWNRAAVIFVSVRRLIVVYVCASTRMVNARMRMLWEMMFIMSTFWLSLPVKVMIPLRKVYRVKSQRMWQIGHVLLQLICL